MKKNNNHTFVICAYKEEPYLEECVKSLLNQEIKSKIIITTSTPNKMIKSIAEKYNIELRINTKTKGHINDFCFAYEQAKTKYVTLCHQDDIYYKDFSKKIINKLEKSKKPIIAFTNYDELRNGKIKKNNLLLIVKRIINSIIIPFKKSKKVRLFSLSLGNAICAPSVTYNKEILSRPLIESDFKSNIDWITYINFAKMDGEFIYLSQSLMAHRIHSNSTTTSVISSNVKNKEDYEIFNMFWPKSISNILIKIYSKSEKNNNIETKGGNFYMKYLMIIIYLILTISGLILYKKGTNDNFMINISNSAINIKLSFTSLMGLLCYLGSFCIYMLILPKFDLTYIMPLMSAVSSISIYLLSIFVLKESVTVFGVIGTIIILLGVFIINIGGK